MQVLKRHVRLVAAAFRRWNQQIAEWQAGNRARWSSPGEGSSPGEEPGYFILIPTVAVVGFVTLWLFTKLGQFIPAHAPPLSGPQIVANLIGYSVIFGPPVMVILLLAASLIGAAFDADKSRHQRKVDAWQAKLRGEQQEALRRQQERDAAEWRRQEAQRLAHAATMRLQDQRLRIALAEQRIKQLETEDAAAGAKLREANR
jgi:hypothetical protein